MIKVDKLNPFGRMCVTLGMLPSSYKESLTYEEQLLWFMDYLENKVIPTVNNNASAVEELQALYLELKTYVDEYFDNLDVQTEINNKLDDMAESGELTSIIAEYISLGATLGYDTVSDMKAAENLVDGSICRTLGYYSLNDGGGSYYRVREIENDDVIDEMLLVALYDDTLVAELIVENNTINSIQIGCVIDDNTFDNGVKLNTILNYCNDNHINFKFLRGVYYVDTPIVITEKLLNIKISGEDYISHDGISTGSEINYTGSDFCFTLAKGGLRYTIEKLRIECNNASSGINCMGVQNTTLNFKNYLNDIYVVHAIIGMKVTSTTYTFINNYTFGGSSNTQIGLLIEGYEFTYVNNSSIDGYNTTDQNSIGLKVNGGLNHYYNNVDIANFGKGKAIYLTDSYRELYTVYFNDINIIRCDGGVVTECDGEHNIVSISYSNILISLSGSNSGSYYFHEIPHSYDIKNVSIENLTVRNLSETTIPDYILVKEDKLVNNLYLQVKDLYGCPVYKSGIYGTSYDSYIYKNNIIKQSGSKYISVVENQTVYEFSIDYPAMANIPVIDVNVLGHNDFVVGNPTYDSGSHKLKCNITFDTAPTGANFRINYHINERGGNQ